MKKILKIEESIKIAKELHEQGKAIILVGGCFDILHQGHIMFLQKAKEYGDTLVVLLESDQIVRKLKGDSRPINTQKDRALVLEALSAVDYVVLLPIKMNNTDYDSLIESIKPDILATTRSDPGRVHKDRQARLVGARVIDVAGRVSKHSTSRLAKLLSEEYYL